jgi:transcriptional regulator with XRE-family HTH domain
MRPTGEAARASLGAELARLRHQRGLTGQELGQLVGMSQAKVSKIENGTQTPSPSDVDAIARALGAPEDVIASLVEQAVDLGAELTEFRVGRRTVTLGQQQIKSVESQARQIRIFQPAIVPGLLQTAEYARAVLSEYVSVAGAAAQVTPQEVVPSGVTARIQRQEALHEPSKQVIVVLNETVLMNRVCSPAAMIAQLERIRIVGADYPNVTVGIVPVTTQLAFPPLHGFQLFDDRHLVIDLSNTAVISREHDTIAVFRTVFESFHEQATTYIEPILDRYIRQYAALLTAE